MAYIIPLRFIPVSKKRSDNRQFDVSICATRIVSIMSTEIYQARKLISDERKNGTLINACGLSKAKSAVILDNGSVVSSPLSVKRLMSLIDKSNQKAGGRIDKRMRVYDVYDGEPTEEDEESEEMAVEYDDEEFEEDDFE